MTEYHQSLIEEYVRARMQYGDLDQHQEDMTQEELERDLANYARTLTLEQLISRCNSYAMAE
jgi:hypothetical protein